MRKYLTLALALVAAFQASASITLEECRKAARENYPEIAMTPLIEQTRDLTLKNITTAWFPQIVVGGQATWQNHVAKFSDEVRQTIAGLGMDVPGLRHDQYHVGALLSQNIWDGGETRAARKITQAETETAMRKTDADLYAVDGRVDDLFFGILLAQEQEKEIELTLNLLESNLRTVEIYYKDGVAMLADVDAVKAQKLTVNQYLKQAKSAEETLRTMLGIFMGRDISTETLIRPESPAVGGQDCERPELKTFDAMENAIDSRRDAIKASLMPKIGLFAGAWYGYPGLNVIKDMTEHKWSFNFLAGINVGWNVGSLYTRSNNLKKLDIEKKQVEVERNLFMFGINLEKSKENGDIKRLQSMLQDDSEIVKLRQAVRNAAESKLRNGVIDTNDLLQKITEESMARQEKTNREIELLKARYELAHTLNQN